MGYYVESIDSSFFLHRDHFEDVYKKMCELNNYDELKRGGCGPNAEWDKTKDKYNPNKWFSWMPHDYPDTTEYLFDVLNLIGFDWKLDDDGNMIDLYYPQNKTGNEDYFLSCFAGYVKDSSFIVFKGEEYEDYYRFIFKNGKMYREEGVISIKFGNPELYKFGKPSARDIYLANYSKSLGLS